MIVIRNCFVAKPGMATKLAAQLKDAATLVPEMNPRVLTDVTGDFNRVILEYTVATVADFETMYARYMTDEAFRAKMAGYTDLWVTGSREILRVA